MAIVKGKEQLCTTGEYRKFFKSFQGIGNYTLFERYDAIENLINKNINENYRHFLAQPVVDSDSITWFSIPFKEAPATLSALYGLEREKYEQIKADTIAEYVRVINSLKKEGKTSEATSLESAIKFIEDRFVFCFDEKTVLGVWGMQLKNDVRDISGILVSNIPPDKPKRKFGVELLPEQMPEPLPEPEHLPGQPDATTPVEAFNVRFHSGEQGTLNGPSEYTKYHNEVIGKERIPAVCPVSGYEFMGWDKDPAGHTVTGDIEFTAQYRKIQTVVPGAALPWYRRFWLWLTTLFAGKGCLKWLLWIFLLLLLLLLFSWLFRGCNGGGVGSNDNPPAGSPSNNQGGIYKPGDPYTPVPTPGLDSNNILPPNQGVLPPLDTSKIINDPGHPRVVSNLLNILMENEDKSITDLAKAFKAKFPGNQYTIVYYDDVVKRLQVQVPAEERERLKQEIPAQFAPEYKLFVFDESLFEPGYTPNDPAFNNPQKSWYLKAVRAPEAWDITKGSKKLTVAIVDNGFSLKHPELAGKVVMPYNVWLHSKEVFSQRIDHGTHVAGTALALLDNAQGICGIAPQTAFMPVQVGDRNGLMTITSVLDGILYALYQGADVINVSLGTEFNDASHYSEAYQQELLQNHFKEEERLWNEIMRIANKHKATIVVAAGNSNILSGIDPIQRPKNIVTVGAVNKSNRPWYKANFSNFGSYNTISAPGVGIYSTVGDGSYTTMDGTSMAAPIVTGAIALMKSLNDSLTNEQIICILQSTGMPTNGNIGKLIQIDKALEKVRNGSFVDCGNHPDNPSTGDVQVLLNWNNYNVLDLVCVDPQGNKLWYKNKKVPSGGQLEIDMNVNANESKTPLENIFWPKGGAPKGMYHVYLVYYKRYEQAIDETAYTIKVKYGRKTDIFRGSIKKTDNALHICTFTLGATANEQNVSVQSLSATKIVVP